MPDRALTPPGPGDAVEPPAPPGTPSPRLALGGRTLREQTARGTIINGVYLVGLYSLSLIRGFVVAALLSVSDYGVWGIVIVTFTTLVWLKQVGISDRYVQQAEVEQEAAFHKAFTLELIFTGGLMALLAAAVPIAALVYGQPTMIAPTLVLTLALAGSALQAPLWVFYRRMDFLRQRRLQAVDPIVAFVITIALAVAGLGYWSLVLGTVAGAWAGGLVALRASPYRPALRYDRGTARRYVGFSWPVVVANLSGIVLAQGSVLAGEQVLGLAGVGIIALASGISDYTNRVDSIITETLYPAICAVRDRRDLLREAFVKSNRLALLWGVPFGFGLALFAGALIDFVLGSRWRDAETLLAAFGAIQAVNHVGFNWDAFYRARGVTRPLAVWSSLTMVAFLAIALPLLVVDGLDGLAIGMGAVSAVSLLVRGWYIRRLFPGLGLVRHAARAIAPSVPAVAAVLAVRALEGAPHTLAGALAQLLLYVAITVSCSYAFERDLLQEVAGLLRRRRPAPRAAT